MLTASDDNTVTSVTSPLSLTASSKSIPDGPACTPAPELEKNFTSSSFESGREAQLIDPSKSNQDRKLDPQAEYDRLMHARKGMSGSEFAGIGMQFAVSIVAFALAGVWLDKRLGTSPWLLLLLVLGGSGLSFWSIYRRVTRKNR